MKTLVIAVAGELSMLIFRDIKYLEVMDGVANGWFHLVFVERWREDGDKRHHVYMEWLEYFLEDGQPTKAILPGS